MKLGLVFRIGAIMLLAVFLLQPDWFAFVFAPMTKNGQPAIYVQNSLLSLTISHLLIVFAATLAASVV
ncbi:MAG: ABC transporter permease, partial [Devosia sp.]